MQKSEWAGVPSLQFLLLTAAVAGMALVPLQWVERLPSICVNHRLFGWCPGCGSLRALVRFFHGDLAGATRFNVNVFLTAPLLAGLAVARLARRSCRRGGG
jgi:hypothetical protein